LLAAKLFVAKLLKRKQQGVETHRSIRKMHVFEPLPNLVRFLQILLTRRHGFKRPFLRSSNSLKNHKEKFKKLTAKPKQRFEKV